MEGKVRVSTKRDGMLTPKIPGYKNITVIMKSHSKWWSLSPYYLKNDEGHLMENIWQFSKVYEEVPRSKQFYSRFDKTVIWEYPQERHLTEDGKLRSCYWKWREQGFCNEYAVRYPIGFQNKSKAKFSLLSRDEMIPLDYIEARKAIYFPVYDQLVQQCPQFDELKAMLERGQNLNIIEIDGPRQESLDYYSRKYDIPDDWIENNSIEITYENMEIMLNDSKHSFGHGYCLAMSLLGMTVEGM